MDNGSNFESGLPEKSKVYDVKPLKRLLPIFPSPPGMSSVTTPQPSPFVCCPPTGPFPPGVQPFYPFLYPDDSQNAAYVQPRGFDFGTNIPAPVPLNSYRGPTGKKRVPGASSSGKQRERQRKKAQNGKEFDIDGLVDRFLTLFKLKEFDEAKRMIGDKETVETVLLVYDLLRRRLTQLEEIGDLNTKSGAKRPDLKSATLLLNKGVRTNCRKRIGIVDGVEVGDIFFFRMELCVVGLHAPTMGGIDYMTVKIDNIEEPLAVSVVSSGGYDDQGDDSDMLIYSGHGGVQRRDGQMFDQKLERGNLALEKSLHRANDVRVIRGVRDGSGGNSKIYVYDGLYKIQESWAEKNHSGCNVFKYKLVRKPGQPEAYSVWRSIQQWKEQNLTRTGLIIPDITSGTECLPVSLVNDVDSEKGPDHFTYISDLKYPTPFSSTKPSLGCNCKGGCQPGNINCSCGQKTKGLLPYSSIGVLMDDVPVINECGQSCTCPPNCRNRISQAGLKVKLEVFKTKNRGWGLRSLDPIRAGVFICEYAGNIIQESTAGGSNGNYIFDATRYYKPLEAVINDSEETSKSTFPLLISAKNSGNVGRFINHSCSPNLFWKPVLREGSNDSLHIAFFSIKHIAPMQELTYDYGIVPPEKGGDQGRKKCFCESPKCRGYFY